MEVGEGIERIDGNGKNKEKEKENCREQVIVMRSHSYHFEIRMTIAFIQSCIAIVHWGVYFH